MKKYFSNYDFIFLDLDNTLFDEKLYLFEAYKNIDQYMLNLNLSLEENEIFNFLKTEFEKNGRRKLFNKLISVYNLSEEEHLTFFLSILREFVPKTKYKLDVKSYELLKLLKSIDKEIIIITNGNPIQQKNKITNIDWRGFNPFVIYANEYKAKPNKECFLPIKNKFKLTDHHKLLYIGDHDVDQAFAENIKSDFLFINKLKCHL